MKTKLIPALAVAAVVAGLVMTSASATVRDAGRAQPLAAAALRAPNADTDGDRIFEDLSARLEKLEADDRVTVILRLGDEPTSERVAGLERTVGGFALTRSLPIIDGVAATMTKAQVEALAHSSSVVSVEEDGVVRALNDSAQESFGVTKARTDIPGLDGDTDGDPATYSKRDLVVAVVDSGIDATHPQLDDGKVLAFVDCVGLLAPDPSACSAKDPFDDNDHGTHVAGTIAGDGEGDDRYKGVAPGAALVGVKVLGADNAGTVGGIVSGIEWVVRNRARYGIEAINLSVGSGVCSRGTDALSRAADAAVAEGLVVVVGAGNRGPGRCTISSPGAAPSVITVGAMADTGVRPGGDADSIPGFNLARFSSRGPTGDGRVKPDIVAPGVHVTSANAGNANNGTSPYVAYHGTSMATPFVAGVALLMLEANATLTPAQIKSIVMSTAIDWGLGGMFHDPGSNGADVDYGAGRLDAFAAIKAAGAPLGDGPQAPAHTVFSGTLTTGGLAQHTVAVSDTAVPLAATLIMPQWSSGSDPDFDLILRDPEGAVVASSARQERQEHLGALVTRTGTYTFEVHSAAGSGRYTLDVSGGSRITESPVATAPGAPISVRAVGGNERATVSWTDPDSDGGSPVTNYVVTPYVGADAQTPATVGNVTEAVIKGLTNGTAYTFTIRARNAVGDGPDSTPSNAVIPEPGRRP